MPQTQRLGIRHQRQRWYDYTGTTFEDMEGWGWRGVHHPDHVERAVEGFSRACESGEPWEDTFPLRGKDGQWRWFLSRALPIRDSDGKVSRWFGTNTDISEQLQTQADLRESQERLGVALDASATGTFRWNIPADELDLGPSLKRLLGLNEDNAPRRLSRLIATVHPDSRADVREHFEQCAEAGGLLKVEFQVIWPDGTRHWLLCKGHTFSNQANQPGYITGACADITDRKRWEEALRASGQHVRNVLNSVTAFVGVMRPEGTLIEANSAALNTAGLKAEDVLDKPVWDTYWFQHSPVAQALLQEATARARNGQSSRFDIEARMKNEFITVDFSLVPMFDASGKVSYLVPSGIDVTERKRITEQLALAKAEADSANQAKSEFLASMSHELRTPLNAIIGYSEMLQEEAEELHAERIIPDLERVRLAGKHLLALINDVLDLSKIEAGKMDVYPEEFAVGELLEVVAATARPLIEKNGNRFEIETAPDLGYMRTDATKLRQILLNLLSNAAKFTENGVVRLKVKRQAGTDASQCFDFCVSDTGIGIAPDQLKRIFEPFTQADRSVSQKFGGTGLGLALSRRFAHMMGGGIDVQSELGKGAAFTARIPISFAPPHRRTSDEVREPEPRREANVLVIDDDYNTRDLLARSLAREGFPAATAATGEEGLRLARELRPQLIILDVLMPGIDGWSVLASLKADDQLCSIPVVVVSMLERQDVAYVLGAADYIVKPVSREQLRRLVDQFCMGGRKHVLVVDDDPDMRNLLRQILEREGCYIVEAEDGLAALESLRARKPDLILLDLEMPRMDGIAFAHEIHAHEEWRTIPIAVITGKDLSPEERLQLKGYVQRIMEKGRYTRDDLMAEVRQLLSLPTTAKQSD